MARPRTKPRLKAEDRLILVRAKVERAKQNLREMEFIIFSAHGYIPGVNMYVKSLKRPPGAHAFYDIPFDALTSAGDVVHNLSGALDHLAYQLTIANRPRTTDKEFRQVYFPICKDKATYEKSRERYKKFFGAKAVEILDSLKPYKGGNEPLWRLHSLNNVSKHRLLLTMAGFARLHAEWLVRDGVRIPFLYKFSRPHFRGIFARPKVNDYILPGGKETLSKLRAGRREALLPSLHYLVDFVETVVGSFLPALTN
jgi:hypothetical protein